MILWGDSETMARIILFLGCKVVVIEDATSQLNDLDGRPI
jgi:hypothetical protein